MEWSLSEDKRTLTTPTGIHVPLEIEAMEIEPCGEVVVVLLDQPRHSDNALAVDRAGKIRWRSDLGLPDPFTLATCKGDKVRLWNPLGMAVTCDVATGAVLGGEVTR